MVSCPKFGTLYTMNAILNSTKYGNRAYNMAQKIKPYRDVPHLYCGGGYKWEQYRMLYWTNLQPSATHFSTHLRSSDGAEEVQGSSIPGDKVVWKRHVSAW